MASPRRLRVTGFQVLRDFEGLSGHLHDYKVDIAKSMLQLGQALGAPLLLVCSSTSTHATGELDAVTADQVHDERNVPRIAFGEPGGLRHKPARSGAEIVEDDHVPARIGEGVDHMDADIARAAGDKDGHGGNFAFFPYPA